MSFFRWSLPNVLWWRQQSMEKSREHLQNILLSFVLEYFVNQLIISCRVSIFHLFEDVNFCVLTCVSKLSIIIPSSQMKLSQWKKRNSNSQILAYLLLYVLSEHFKVSKQLLKEMLWLVSLWPLIILEVNESNSSYSRQEIKKTLWKVHKIMVSPF